MSARQVLPQRRPHELFTFQHWGMKFHAGIGRAYHDGPVQEVFINVGKTGDHLESLMRDAAMSISHSLQRGATVDELRHSAMRDRTGEPSSPIGKLLDLLGDA